MISWNKRERGVGETDRFILGYYPLETINFWSATLIINEFQ